MTLKIQRSQVATIKIAVLLGILAVLTRIPFQAQILHHWDSINFALALDNFDVRLHQPHPPGTFVLYILLGRLVNLFLHDPNASLVWVSIVTGALGIAALFWLSHEMFGREVAIVTGLLALTSPLIWFHSEVALSYGFEFFWVPLVVYFCYKLHTRSWWALLTSALLIGMAGGIRPNTPVFLFPLWCAGLLIHRYPLRRIFLALVVMGLGVLIWAVPMVVMSGGLAEYLDLMQWWQAQHTEESGTVMGIAENVIRFGAYAFYALGSGLLLLPVAATRHGASIIRSLMKDWRVQTMAIWLLPATAYFTLIHLRQPGHTFTIQPALLLLTGLALVALARSGEGLRRPFLIGMTVVVVVVNAAFFVAGPTYLFGDTRMLFTTPSWNTIRDYDARITTRVAAIRANFSPQTTVVFSRGRTQRIPDFYLADFQWPLLSTVIAAYPVTFTQPIDTLVFFDEEALPSLPPDVALQSIPLPDGERVYYVTWEASQVAELSRDRLWIRDGAGNP